MAVAAAASAFLVQPSSLTFASRNSLRKHSFGSVTNTSLLIKTANARGLATSCASTGAPDMASWPRPSSVSRWKLLRVTGVLSIPVWYNAGAVKFGFANTETLIVVQFLLMGFAETKRYMDYKTPGSQAKDGSFFGVEAALEGLEPGYPGGPLLMQASVTHAGPVDNLLLHLSNPWHRTIVQALANSGS